MNKFFAYRLLVLMGVFALVIFSTVVHELTHIYQVINLNGNVKSVCFAGYWKETGAFGWVIHNTDSLKNSEYQAYVNQFVFILLAIPSWMKFMRFYEN